MLRLASQLPEYPVVIAIYSVGESLGPHFIAEIGDISQFRRARFPKTSQNTVSNYGLPCAHKTTNYIYGFNSPISAKAFISKTLSHKNV